MAHQLAHQVDVRRVGDPQQHDGEVAGDRVAPQRRLPAMIAGDHFRAGAQRRIGEDDRAGESRIQARIGFGRVDLAQERR